MQVRANHQAPRTGTGSRGWREQCLLVVSVDDDRLDWVERELIRRIGERLYGAREVRHG